MIDIPKVLNAKECGFLSDPHSIYCGRPSKWGNPFEVGVDGNRQEVIHKYKLWLHGEVELIKEAKKELYGMNLVCWCKPKDCHCDHLIIIVNGSSFFD